MKASERDPFRETGHPSSIMTAIPKNNPLVTIGIPTYNRAESYLKDSLESALGQTYSNLEIVVSDNCSTDRTKSLVRSYGDPRIVYHRHQRPVEPHENADYCVDHAQGNYFLLLHDDDLIDPDFVELCTNAFRRNDVRFVQTGARTIDANGKVVNSRNADAGVSDVFLFFDSIIKGEAVTYFCNTLYDLDALREVGGFRSRTYTYQDVATNIRLAVSRGRFGIAEPKASYRKFHLNKWGASASIKKWSEDSVFLIELMSELLPEKREYIFRSGLEAFCRRSYKRLQKNVPMPGRLLAYWNTYKSFEFVCPPWIIQWEKAKRRFTR